MSVPLVSIGVPVYNGARTLGRVLESLARQTYPNIEIVISDNGSTDDSAAIATSFAGRHDNVRVERVAQNRGAVWNFNRVVELSRGEFFMWAAHDDERDVHYIERAIGRLLQDPTASVCHSQVEQVNGEGRTIRVDRTRLVADSPNAHDRFARTLEPLSWQFAIYGLIRRAALERTHGVRNYYWSDFALVSELSIQGPILQIEAPLFRYCVIPEQRLDRYLARVIGSLHPNNRYRPWVSLRAIVAVGHVRSVLKAQLGWRETSAMMGDVVRWFCVGPGSRDELLRFTTALIGVDRVERWRQERRRRRAQ